MLQVGPAPTVEPISPLPPEMQQQREMSRRNAYVEVLPETSRLARCLAQTRTDPGRAVDEAEAWLAEATDADARGDAGQCLGVAQAQLGQREAAAETFLAARDATPADNPRGRALRGALAGGALLAGGDAEGALALLDRAQADAETAGDATIRGQIAIDRAIALVALGRADDAAAALDVARTALPDNGQAWLLSATLARREGDLAEAQTRIERAAELAPLDPAVGLEAGVIAVLAGRDDAARQSWRSVIEAAPDSAEAATAQAYLDQLESA
jgi:tetratricopeptide (TPR) repeat protein